MKKIGVLFVSLIVVAMSVIPLASAVPLSEKNNEKFESYSVTGVFSMLTVFNPSAHEFIPSEDNSNKLIISYDEAMVQYNITVNGQTYHLNKDFTYSGHALWVFTDPVMDTPYYPASFRSLFEIMTYTYDFSAVSGGIDGTINLRCVANGGGSYINSLSGTGDLQTVQIKAEVTGSNYVDTYPYPLTIYHAGFVSGWPDIPPAP